jgi:hypothetical protein
MLLKPVKEGYLPPPPRGDEPPPGIRGELAGESGILTRKDRTS